MRKRFSRRKSLAELELVHSKLSSSYTTVEGYFFRMNITTLGWLRSPSFDSLRFF